MSVSTRDRLPLLLAVLMMMLAGCQTRPAIVERAQHTASDFRKSLAEINPQIDRIFATLAQLQRTDITVHGAAFAQYQTHLETLKELVLPVRYQADNLRREGIDYFKAWSQEMIAADSSAARHSLELSRSQADTRYRLFMEYIDNASDDFRELYHELKDIEEYLAPDLSNANIAAQKPLIDATTARSYRVKGRIDLIGGEISKWISGQ